MYGFDRLLLFSKFPLDCLILLIYNEMGSLYSITGEDNPEKCNLCNEKVTCLLNHIIKDCTEISNKREVLKDKAREEDREWNTTWTCDSLKETSNRIAHTLG